MTVKNLDHATTAELTRIAAFCFELGVRHANEGKGLLTWDTLRQHWAPHFGITDWRQGHTRKFRQVYGAGYDITRMMARVKARKPPQGREH